MQLPYHEIAQALASSRKRALLLDSEIPDTKFCHDAGPLKKQLLPSLT